MLRYLVSHPTAANLLMALLMVAGLLSLSQIRRETFPDFQSVEVQISAVYPGATAEDVEEGICQRIEDALDGVRFVSEVRSEAREGVGIVTVEMVDGGDFSAFKDEIDTEVSAITEFPTEVEDPTITQLHTTDAVLSLLVSGPMSAPDLKAYCEDLKDRLQLLAEVSLVEIGGFSDHQFRVELPHQTLMRYGLSVADIADIINRQNLDLPLGTIETTGGEILIRFLDQRTSTAEIEDLVIIGSAQGAEIRLGDLGRVVDLFELEEEKLTSNGDRAALLRIEKSKSQDTIRVARAVKGFIEAERLRQPQLQLAITQDMSTLVTDRLSMLVKNGWQGMLLVFFTMWVFFNIRLSFWVVMSLPVSFLGAFFFLPHVGLTINMLTMVGLLLALGLLMDDGIVIAENIASHRARGKNGMQAAIDGTREVAGGVLSSFTTTICVLGPLATISGDMGKILKVVPLILILVMSISLIEAFCILPNHLSHSLQGPEKRQPRLRRRLNGVVDWVRDILLGGAVERLITWRYLWVGTVVFLLLGSVSMLAGGVLRFQAFPEIDGDTIVARILLPPGTPLARTEEVVEQVSEGLEALNGQYQGRVPAGERLVQTVYTQYNVNTEAFESGSHVATVSVDLIGAAERDARLDDILQSWRQNVGVVADSVSLVFAEPSFGPAGRAIDIRFQGKNLAELNEAARATMDYLREFRGVSNLNIDLRRGKPELRLRLREGALGLGVDASAIARQLRAAFQGVTATELQVGSEAYEVDVQLRPASQDSLADLDAFRFTLPDG
ncbi:MAG: efflux RND transporter permease subunit, partial [Phycisphaerales bacterium JB038]